MLLDLQKINQMFKFKTHHLDNFNFVQAACEDAMTNNKMIGIIAPSGVGKSYAINYFKNTNENVFYTELSESITSKEMYTRILNSIQKNNIRYKEPVTELIWKIENELANKSSKSLIIIDEAGKFNKKRVGYFHELRNFTQHKCGIIISGPSYFEKDILSWIDDGLNGVDEFYTRVSYWVKLIRPTNAEIKAVFKNEELGKNDAEKELLSSIIKFPYEKRSWRKIEMFIQQFFLNHKPKKMKK